MDKKYTEVSLFCLEFFHSSTFAAHSHPSTHSLAPVPGSDAYSTLRTGLRLCLIDVGCGVYQSRS